MEKVNHPSIWCSTTSRARNRRRSCRRRLVLLWPHSLPHSDGNRNNTIVGSIASDDDDDNNVLLVVLDGSINSSVWKYTFKVKRILPLFTMERQQISEETNVIYPTNQPNNRPFVHPIIRLTTHCSWTNSHLTHLEISGCKKTAENTRFVCVPRKEGKACHERHHSTSKVSVYSHRDGEDVAPSNGKATVKLTTITTATETARPTWLGSAGKVR